MKVFDGGRSRAQWHGSTQESANDNPLSSLPFGSAFLGSNRLEDFVATGVTRSAEEDSTRDRFSARKVPKNIEAKDFTGVAKLTSLKKSTQRRVHQALLNWTGPKSWRSLSNASNTFT